MATDDDESERDDRLQPAGREERWAIMITLPHDGEMRGAHALMDADGDPLTFATEAEAHAAVRGPKLRPYFVGEEYWLERTWRRVKPPEDASSRLAREKRISESNARLQECAAAEKLRLDREVRAKVAAAVRERDGPVNDNVPPDLHSVYLSLVPIIVEWFETTADDEDPVVLFAALDTRALQEASSLTHVPAERARALCAQGAHAVLDFAETLLDPDRQAEVVASLGGHPAFRPNVVVLLRHVWRDHEFVDGVLKPRLHYVSTPGAIHALQVELHTRNHGSLDVRWPVLHGEDGGGPRVVPTSPLAITQP